MDLFLFLVPSMLVAAAYVMPLGAAPLRDEAGTGPVRRAGAEKAVRAAGACPCAAGC